MLVSSLTVAQANKTNDSIALVLLIITFSLLISFICLESLIKKN